MKKVFLTAILVLIPLTVFAQTPFDTYFMKAADRMGIDRGTQERIIRFAEGLKDDMLVDCTITSIYPPVVDITFASGKEIHADGNVLEISDWDDWENEPYEDYSILCYSFLIVGYLLEWIGFFNMSFQLMLTGFELLFFAIMMCI